MNDEEISRILAEETILEMRGHEKGSSTNFRKGTRVKYKEMKKKKRNEFEGIEFSRGSFK